MTRTRHVAVPLIALVVVLGACSGTRTPTRAPDVVASPAYRSADPEDTHEVFVSPLGTSTPRTLPDTRTNVPVPAPDLDGTEWVLESLSTAAPLSGTQITLRFDGDQAGGFAGCNRYGGAARAVDGSLTFSEMAMTAQACLDPDGVMDQEAAYIQALLGATAYEVTQERLGVANAAGETTLVFTRRVRHMMDPTDLVGTSWRLASLEGAGTSTIELRELTITLAFDSDALVIGHSGCRDYVATYTADGDRLGFPSMAMIEAGCTLTHPVMVIEGRYTDGLTWADQYRLTEDRLEIRTARGEVLRFEAVPDNMAGVLQGTFWLLTAFLDQNRVEGMDTPALVPTDVQPGLEITVQFGDGVLSGSTDCYRYGGTYHIEGHSISIQTPAIAGMTCPEPAAIMQQQQRYLASLSRMRSYSIHGEQLVLKADAGQILIFRSRTAARAPSN